MKIQMLVAIIVAAVTLVSGASSDTIAPVGGDMGTYRMHCNVEAARVYFDGEFKGNISSGILDVPVFITGTPYRNFTIEKEGYYPYAGQITRVPVKGSVVQIYATMSAIPPVEYGTLHLLITPASSAVSFDGRYIADVPSTGVMIIRDVVPGYHTVQVSRAGYEPVTREVRVAKNEIQKVSLSLLPLAYGSLAVTSTPPGAEVILDGVSKGVTPLTIPEVEAGEYRLVLMREGYEAYATNVSVGIGEESVDAALLPSSSARGSSIGLSLLVLIGALGGAVLLAGLKRSPR